MAETARTDAQPPASTETRAEDNPASAGPDVTETEGDGATAPSAGAREGEAPAADVAETARTDTKTPASTEALGRPETDESPTAQIGADQGEALPVAEQTEAARGETPSAATQTAASVQETEGGPVVEEAVPEAPMSEPTPVPEPAAEPDIEAVVSDAPMSEPTPVPEPAAEPDIEAVVPDAPLSEPTPVPGPTPTPDVMDMILGFPSTPEPTPKATPEPDVPKVTVEPSPTPNRRVHTGALPFPLLEKVTLDPEAILPELKEIYELNHDLVGWINIPDTVIDYPVVQVKDSDFYLSHDFYGEENVNGQIILDTLCDPYTPSYNLVISGHHMKNGSMFGDLPKYASKSYWASHRFLEFDSLMTRKKYVVFAAFYSADYDEDEEGFRYNADIQYRLDADLWLEEVRQNQLYDTEIDVAFGDEFITLTTCNRARRRDGRFVVVCRKIREGETFE